MPPVLASAPEPEEKRARLAALRETLARKGLRVESADTPAAPAALATGWPEVDALLRGGLPRRAISEVLGPAAGGKTSLVVAALAGVTRAGALAAWIDASGEAYPPAFAAAGVALPRLLFVRPDTPERQLWAAEVLLQSGSFGAVVLDATALPPPPRAVLDRRAPVLRGAAESHGTALVVLAEAPFGLPHRLRLRVEPRPGSRLRVSLEKARTGAPERAIETSLRERP